MIIIIFNLITVGILTYVFIFKGLINIQTYNIKTKILGIKQVSMGLNNIKNNINELKRKNLLKKEDKRITPIIIILASLTIFVLAFITLRAVIKITSTAIILSFPMLFVINLVIKGLILREKNQTMSILPSYVVNLKNYIDQNNNIVAAIKETPSVNPLKPYIEKFNVFIGKGMNIANAFDILKEDVNVKNFSDLINAFSICYLNGGNFSKILEKFIENITKENIQKEQTKENAYSSILTLGIMLIINIYLVFGFVFNNLEYSLIVRETLLGRTILNINAISYIVIGFFVYKIYRIGE